MKSNLAALCSCALRLPLAAAAFLLPIFPIGLCAAPANFKVTRGRLFLFYKGLWGNAKKDWDREEASLTAKADANWKRIAGE